VVQIRDPVDLGLQNGLLRLHLFSQNGQVEILSTKKLLEHRLNHFGIILSITERGLLFCRSETTIGTCRLLLQPEIIGSLHLVTLPIPIERVMTEIEQESKR
jgi:hypothetical protein